MTTLKQRLADLRKENKARTAAQNVDLTNQAPTRKEESVSKGKPSKSWKRKRQAWIKHYSEHPDFEAPAGEIANILDGLDPEGYDKSGRKVSFIERGKELTSRSSGISSRPVYIGKR